MLCEPNKDTDLILPKRNEEDFILTKTLAFVKMMSFKKKKKRTLNVSECFQLQVAENLTKAF